MQTGRQVARNGPPLLQVAAFWPTEITASLPATVGGEQTQRKRREAAEEAAKRAKSKQNQPKTTTAARRPSRVSI